ncbi:MAG: VOC family protein [Acidobacteria bacterium]|nr:VOC family protein [Acidobacteriota bacterium]
MIEVVDVAHVMFNVTDLERSLKLYRDLLGFKVSGGYEGAVIWLNMGQYKEGTSLAFHDLGLYKVPNPAPENARKVVGLNHAAFRLRTAEDVDKAAELLRANGVKILKGPLTHKEDNDRFLYFEDPDGNVLELVASTLPNFPDGYLGNERRTD